MRERFILEKYVLVNSTIPQGLTTTQNEMRIRFDWRKPKDHNCPSLKDCVKFTIMVDSGEGKWIINNLTHYYLRERTF